METGDYFRIGTILKPKGLKGELHIYADFEGLENIKFNTIFIEITGKLVPYFVSSVKYLQKNAAYLVLEDVDTIEKTSLLVKKHIYLPNKLKPKRKKQEFTLFDLKGFTAVDVNEGVLGIITAVHEYPQQIIAAVDFRNKEILFPLNEEIIKGIDAVKEIVTVDLPEGLLDVYLD
ncbi:MAG TPA: ribosome maturation factor RimM [Mucilaginibacter sp.]